MASVRHTYGRTRVINQPVLDYYPFGFHTQTFTPRLRRLSSDTHTSTPRLPHPDLSNMRFDLPTHRQITTWGDSNKKDGNWVRRTFKQLVQDKSTFYRYSSAQWDKAAAESYQLKDDITIIAKWGNQVADLVGAGHTIVDYGPGATDKVLPAMKMFPEGVHYLAVDMDRPFLEHTIREVAKVNRKGTSAGIQTKFEHFPEILSRVRGPKLVISFGSNLFNHPDPLVQMRPIADNLELGDKIWLSIDCHGMEHEEKVTATYKCPEFMRFIDGTLGQLDGYEPEQWEITSGLKATPMPRYAFTLTAKENVKIGDELYPKGMSFEFFPCYKSTENAIIAASYKLGLRPLASMGLYKSEMLHFLLEKDDDAIIV